MVSKKIIEFAKQYGANYVRDTGIMMSGCKCYEGIIDPFIDEDTRFLIIEDENGKMWVDDSEAAKNIITRSVEHFDDDLNTRETMDKYFVKVEYLNLP